MKKLTLLLLLSFFLINCKKEKSDDFSGIYQLTRNVPVTTSKGGFPLTITFKTFENPCPPNALCIWDGNSVYITFKTSEDEQTIYLCNADCNPLGLNKDIIALNDITYKVKRSKIFEPRY